MDAIFRQLSAWRDGVYARSRMMASTVRRPTMARVPVLSYSELVGTGQIASVGVVSNEPLAVAR